GEPWLSAGLYDPSAKPGRSNDPHGQDYNAALVPRELTRNLRSGRPNDPAREKALAKSPDYAAARGIIEELHNSGHGYIGGTIGDAHTSFRDPFVFLLHSNVDRLFALWQLQSGHAERLDP